MAPEQSTSQARPATWRLWLLAARPATLLASVVPIVVGSALAAADHGLHLQAAIAALLSAMLIQIGTNFYNDYADFTHGADTAERLGPLRVVQRGFISPRDVLRASMAAFALSVFTGSFLLWTAGWPVVVMGTLSISAGVAYTGGPYPLGYHGLGDLFVFLFFGLMGVCGTYYVQLQRVSAASCAAAIAVGALATAILVVNNLRDRYTDKPAGKRTLAVRFGARFTRLEYSALVGMAYLLPSLVWATGLGGRGWLLPWASLPGAIWLIRAVWRLDGAALNTILQRTAQLEAVFGLLLTLGVLW